VWREVRQLHRGQARREAPAGRHRQEGRTPEARKGAEGVRPPRGRWAVRLPSPGSLRPSRPRRDAGWWPVRVRSLREWHHDPHPP